MVLTPEMMALQAEMNRVYNEAIETELALMESPGRCVRCPCCDLIQDSRIVARPQIQYSIKFDEMTCFRCGLVASVNEFRGHWIEMQERAEREMRCEV